MDCPEITHEEGLMPAAKRKQLIRAGLVGYGGAFNMGRHHAEGMQKTGVMKVVAVCDPDPKRREAAKQELPGVSTFASVGAMLRGADFDLAIIITPHNSHARLALQCLRARKHVILEKPMCITVREATAMIEAAKRSKVMLSVYHNRRWDGDYLAIREVIAKGLIGDVFHLEAFGGGYGHPGHWWRSNKRISGGAFYDWGAHFVDWVLGIIPEKIVNVTGFFHKRVWKDVTNEDQVRAVVRFANGAVADVQLSNIARAGKPRWRILGTKGAIVDEGGGSLRVTTDVQGMSAQMEVKHKQGEWHKYYENIAAHLTKGAPLIVKAEQARRVIEVIEYAERSSKAGRSLPVPYP
jgi:predicted dehydrogenase